MTNPSAPGRKVSGGTGPATLSPGPIVITRRLAAAGRALVIRGQQVDPDTPLLSMDTFPGRVLRAQVARPLRVSPDRTEDTVLPRPGQLVRQGDFLARSSMFWSHLTARSDDEGSVAGVSPSLGVVYLREHLPTQIAETIQISVIEELSGDKNHFRSYLRVKDGDNVEKGQLIATREIAHVYKNILSPVFGTVCNVAPLLGTLSIIPDQVASVVTAHIPGVVAAVRDDREVDVIGYGVSFDGLVGVGGETHGPLLISANDASPWRPGPRDDDLAGCVLVTGMIDHQSLQEAATRQVAGVVAGRAHQSDVCRYVGREIGVIATGREDVPLVLVLTEGFGSGAMAPRLHALLASVANQTASLSGTTHIRAGVIRPRLIASFMPPADLLAKLQAKDRPLEAANTIGLVEVASELKVGLRARILRGPYAGRSGIIRQLVPGPQTLPTGAKALVAVVKLDAIGDGRAARPGEVIVAQANLKLEGGETNG